MSKSADWSHLQDLFCLYCQGEFAAVTPLYEGLAAVLRRYLQVRGTKGADSDDLIQVVLLKIHIARQSFDPAKSLKTWVFTIASRCLIDHWRSIKTGDQVGLIDDDGECFLQSSDLSPDLKFEYGNDLTKALGALKPIDRQIVYLYAVEGFLMEEISAALSLTENAVKLRAHRAYLVLRKLL